MSDSVPIKFPPPKPRDTTVKLSLPRRRPIARASTDIIDASAAARESINALFSASRTPFAGGAPRADGSKLIELERTLRQLEQSLAERERAIAETESRLTERERDIAEAEALFLAREQVTAATRRQVNASGGVSPEEKQALEQLRAELERQEEHLKEEKQVVRERQLFLDESEAKLFDKVQEQQDTENELEQRDEDLRARERRIRE